ncbi:MAG TPA: RNA methyltransferase [Myxococcaceae bacterium]|jgi:tRNA (guanosine-2'-O-)-methyltransferase|nr:RNA methyltransferase [Myxococcaceae bacterium]
MPGGGPKYEAYERSAPDPERLLLDARKERIDRVLAERTRTVTVVLDRLEDNFNMGAVVRTCEGMGLQEMHVIRNPLVSFRPNSKVTQGCDKWVDLHVHRDFAACRDHLRARGYALWASAPGEGAKSLYELRFDSGIALVFGNERFGVSPEVLDGCDGRFWIPMRGFTQSLNVSAAVSAAVTRAVSWRVEHLGSSGDLSPEEIASLRERFRRLSVKQRHRLYRPGEP